MKRLLAVLFIFFNLSVQAQTWTNQSLTGGMETLAFSATPLVTGTTQDVIIGLSAAPVTNFTALAVAVRFASNGVIDVRNGSSYGALLSMPYKVGMSYDFMITMNIPAHTYSVTVRPSDANAPVTLATNYKFRTEQAAVKQLSNLAVYTDKGSAITVTNAAISTPINPVQKSKATMHPRDVAP